METKEQNFTALIQTKSAEMAAVAVATAAKAEVESAYVMALKQPRNENDARVKIKQACQNPLFAEKARYAKPVGGNKIIGPSIRLVEEMMRHWGNVLVQQTAIYEDRERRIVKVTVRDLEANLSYSKEVTIEKTVERKSPSADREIVGERINSTNQRVFIVAATEDELMNKEAAHVSKVIRNSGLRLIPDDIAQDAMDTCKETVLAKVKDDPGMRRNALLDQFGALGILPSMVAEYMGCPVEQLTPAQLVELQDIHTAIRDGQATWAEYNQKAVDETDQPEKEAKASPSLKDKLKDKAKGPVTAGGTAPPTKGPVSHQGTDALPPPEDEAHYKALFRKHKGEARKLNEIWAEVQSTTLHDDVKANLYGHYTDALKGK